MKNIKYKKSVLIMLFSVIGINFTYAQSDISGTGGTGHQGASLSYWCGWDANTTYDLDIKHMATSTNAKNINFYTKATKKMTIVGSNGSTDGYVGIGTASPNYLLHQDGGASTATYHQFTNGATSGTGSGNGLLVGITSADDAEINMQDDNYLKFKTSGTTRIFVKNGTTGGGGKVAIGNTFTAPASRLHIKESGVADAWFQITGNNTGDLSTDGLRIGIENPANGPFHAHFKLQENADMDFQTGATTTQKMIIKSDGKVGINQSSPAAQLEVVSSDYSISNIGLSVSSTGNQASATNTAGTFTANNGNPNYGVRCTAAAGVTTTPGTSTGGEFTGQDGTSYNYGVHAYATNANATAANIGGWFKAEGTSGSSNYGVRCSTITAASNNVAGYFEATGGTNTNYAVYATSPSSCTTGVGMCPSAAGYFNGLVYSTGNLVVSDAALKDNVTPVANGLSVINQLSPKTFTFKTQDYPSMNLEGGTHYGLIAEDVEQILPELVHPFSEPEVTDANGNIVTAQVDFKAVNYTELISLLVAGMKEQQTRIDGLEATINGCCNLGNRTGAAPSNTNSIELENVAGLQLLEADPNPFSESTMIKWNIPDAFQNAVLYFYDNKGNQINTYKVSSKGAGELQIFGSKLSSGIYTYTLVVDGKLIDSKKMMKSK